MDNYKKVAYALILVINIFIQSCTYQEPITRRSQLRYSAFLGHPISVLTIDSALYRLVNYQLTDSMLRGDGKVTKDEKESKFSGEIRLNNIVLIQTATMNNGKIPMIIAGGITFIAMAKYFLDQSDNYIVIEKQERYTTSSGNESCPIIYSWNGKHYIMEGEAIAVGFGKALELETTTLLPSLKPEKGEVKVRMTNEQLETHYINKIDLVAFEADEDARVILDAHDIAWPVYHLQEPITASDGSGRSIQDLVKNNDGKYWESDIQDMNVLKDFEDVIEVTFSAPPHRNKCTLVLKAINTEISSVVFRQMFSFLGDETLAFVRAAEEDKEMVDVLKNWIDESSLKVELWQNGIWKPVGALKPEANAVPFERAIRIESGLKESQVRLRLRCQRDVWKIDAIQVDWTPVEPLKMNEAVLHAVIGPFGKDVQNEVRHSDLQYVALLPPQGIDIKAKCCEPVVGKKIIYGLKVRGYLYEWAQENSKLQTSTWGELVPHGMKVEFLKKLLLQKQIFLPPIYAEWKKECMSGKGYSGI